MPNKSLNELMGGKGHEAKARDLSLDDLPELLGERCPDIKDHTPVGRLRLMQALRNRFGDGFKNLPGIANVLKQFDRECEFNLKKHEMRALRAGKKD